MFGFSVNRMFFSVVRVARKDIQIFKVTGDYFIYSNPTSSITGQRISPRDFFIRFIV